MQTLHLLTSEEMAELQELVDGLGIKQLLWNDETKSLIPGIMFDDYIDRHNAINRIAEILGLEVKDETD